jgi:RimJ/RimL family protein N-acetyltransferase
VARAPVERLEGSAVVLQRVQRDHISELKRILDTPEVSARWGTPDEPDWPFDDPGVVGYVVLVGGRVRGFVQYAEETDPDYRHASIDIFLDPDVNGRGLGRDAIRTLTRHLIRDREHHRIVIDPAADNEAAIHCYQAVGFRRVGIMRRYERDRDGAGWHDGVLMDLLAEDLG